MLFERDEYCLENIDELWIAALNKIEGKISKPSFDTWLKNTVAEKLEGDTLIVNVPNEFARDWLEGRYTKLITDILYDLTGAKLTARSEERRVGNECKVSRRQ